MFYNSKYRYSWTETGLREFCFKEGFKMFAVCSKVRVQVRLSKNVDFSKRSRFFSGIFFFCEWFTGQKPCLLFATADSLQNDFRAGDIVGFKVDLRGGNCFNFLLYLFTFVVYDEKKQKFLEGWNFFSFNKGLVRKFRLQDVLFFVGFLDYSFLYDFFSEFDGVQVGVYIYNNKLFKV